MHTRTFTLHVHSHEIRRDTVHDLRADMSQVKGVKGTNQKHKLFLLPEVLSIQLDCSL